MRTWPDRDGCKRKQFGYSNSSSSACQSGICSPAWYRLRTSRMAAWSSGHCWASSSASNRWPMARRRREFSRAQFSAICKNRCLASCRIQQAESPLRHERKCRFLHSTGRWRRWWPRRPGRPGRLGTTRSRSLNPGQPDAARTVRAGAIAARAARTSRSQLHAAPPAASATAVEGVIRPWGASGAIRQVEVKGGKPPTTRPGELTPGPKWCNLQPCPIIPVNSGNPPRPKPRPTGATPTVRHGGRNEQDL